MKFYYIRINDSIRGVSALCNTATANGQTINIITLEQLAQDTTMNSLTLFTEEEIAVFDQIQRGQIDDANDAIFKGLSFTVWKELLNTRIGCFFTRKEINFEVLPKIALF